MTVAAAFWRFSPDRRKRNTLPNGDSSDQEYILQDLACAQTHGFNKLYSSCPALWQSFCGRQTWSRELPWGAVCIQEYGVTPVHAARQSFVLGQPLHENYSTREDLVVPCEGMA